VPKEEEQKEVPKEEELKEVPKEEAKPKVEEEEKKDGVALDTSATVKSSQGKKNKVK
jgi:hypothetical protein